MPFRHFSTAVIVAGVLSGCASAPAANPAPPSDSEQNVTVYPTIKRWIGTLSPTQSFQATATASRRQNAHGRVELTVSPSAPTLSHVVLTVSLPTEQGMNILGWGLSQGRCGSGSPPVLSPSAFPPIQVSTSGQGNVDIKLPFILSETGTYHVNVFRGSGTQLNNVITCAQLRRES
jgi:hypothetical protein